MQRLHDFFVQQGWIAAGGAGGRGDARHQLQLQQQQQQYLLPQQQLLHQQQQQQWHTPYG